jgi:hypothetical protein
VIAGIAVLIGASLLLLLGEGHEPTEEDKAVEETVPVVPVPGTAA